MVKKFNECEGRHDATRIIAVSVLISEGLPSLAFHTNHQAYATRFRRLVSDLHRLAVPVHEPLSCPDSDAREACPPKLS